MFVSLDAFADKPYFDTHRTGTLITVSGKSYKIELFAACKAQATDKIIFSPTETGNEELLDYIDKKSAVFYAGTAGSQSKIIGLSTCQSAESYERIIVFGVLTEIAD